ncbi:hypothetical protein ACG873_00960 (plasmid) [Mesorhizobium sp. AaZ16]|uniref:hypothetical protein n=1 Tax=Mesorhizobium sp. AaZ16 TaxID=3402289 RepID=UPI00374F4D16
MVFPHACNEIDGIARDGALGARRTLRFNSALARQDSVERYDEISEAAVIQVHENIAASLAMTAFRGDAARVMSSHTKGGTSSKMQKSNSVALTAAALIPVGRNAVRC